MAFWREVLTFEPHDFDLRLGIIVVIVTVLAFGLAVLVGSPGFVIVLAVMLTLLCDQPGPVPARLQVLAAFAVVGAALLAVASVTASPLALTMGGVFAVTLLCSLAVRYGARVARAAALLNIWFLVALLLAPSTDLLQGVLSWLAGSALAIGAIWLLVQRAPQPATIADAAVRAIQGQTAFGAQLQAIPWQPWIVTYVLVRAAGTALATLVGGLFFVNYPLWATLTVVVVVQPSRDKSAVKGVQRVIGTAAGIVLGMALVTLLPPVWLLGAVLVVSFLYGAATLGNYALNIVWLTSQLILITHLTGDNPFAASVSRILEVLLGLAIAAITYTLLLWLVEWARKRGKAPPVAPVAE